MKINYLILFLIFFSSLNLNQVYALEKRGQKNVLGGVQVDDPFSDMNKGGSTRADRKKAEDIMAQLGYGKKAKTQSGSGTKRSEAAK
jgi:hypothetical protein